MFENSEWIWIGDSKRINDRVNFRKVFYLENVPERAVIKIGCETKYWLFVNGMPAIYDGGLFRESIPGCGYYDEADITKFLKTGENEIVWHVWYFGNGGRNNTYCERAGLIYECRELQLYSDETTEAEKDTAYYTTEQENPSYLYGGHNVGYDARIKKFSFCPQFLNVGNAESIGKYGDAPWGELKARPIPLFVFGEKKSCSYLREKDACVVTLPYAMQFAPYIKICAVGGEIVDIRSDRYGVNGGPGGCSDIYYGHRAEYICCKGEQEFEMLDWIFGEKIFFKMPESVKILEIGYRESCFETKQLAKFRNSDSRAEKLFEKCIRTLKVCMRENYMDCPDRERGQWIGDVSVQAPQIVMLLDKNALLLLKKSIHDFINLRKGDVLVGNVPGDNYCELPSQSLNAISNIGVVATYYRATGDKETLRLVFTPAIRYLKLWKTDKDGMLISRKGDWKWFDHLFNVDEDVLEHCWYYSALTFAAFMAEELDEHGEDSFIQTRLQSIKLNFESRYWKGYGYSSSDFVDDRANAMAVLAQLCPPENYEKVRYLLMSVFNSTTYMENYVLKALCEMGFKNDAYRRMMCRYQPLIDNDNSTLWEDFFHLGTRNHAWSGGPAVILYQYFNEYKS